MKRGQFLRSLVGLPAAVVAGAAVQRTEDVEWQEDGTGMVIDVVHLNVPTGEPTPPRGNENVSVVGPRWTMTRTYRIKGDKRGELYFVDDERGTVRRLT